MKLVIVGPGAVGRLIGGLLRLEGHEVALVGRHGAVTAAHGIRISLPTGWLVADGFLPAVPAEADWVMVAVGRQHLAGLKAGGLALPAAAAGTLLWNCDPAGPSRLGLAGPWSVGLTLLTAVRMQDDDVEVAGDATGAVGRAAAPPLGTLVIERRSGAAPLLRPLLSRGMRILVVDDIRPFHDSFLVSRLLELPAAMCGTTVGHFLAYPAGRQIAAGVLSEGILAMERSGRSLARLPHGDPRELLARISRRPGDFDRLRDLPSRAYSSTLQAFLRSRPHEARELNGRLLELGSTARSSLSWNWRLFQKAGRVAGAGFFHDPADLMRSI